MLEYNKNLNQRHNHLTLLTGSNTVGPVVVSLPAVGPVVDSRVGSRVGSRGSDGADDSEGWLETEGDPDMKGDIVGSSTVYA